MFSFIFLYQWGNRLVPSDGDTGDAQVEVRQRDETKVNITQRSWSYLDGSVKVLTALAVFLSPRQVRCLQTAASGV